MRNDNSDNTNDSNHEWHSKQEPKLLLASGGAKFVFPKSGGTKQGKIYVLYLKDKLSEVILIMSRLVYTGGQVISHMQILVRFFDP